MKRALSIIGILAIAILLGVGSYTVFHKGNKHLSDTKKEVEEKAVELVGDSTLDTYMRNHFGFALALSDEENNTFKLNCNDANAPGISGASEESAYITCDNDSDRDRVMIGWQMGDPSTVYEKTIASIISFSRGEKSDGEYFCESDKSYIWNTGMPVLVKDCYFKNSAGEKFYYSLLFFRAPGHKKTSTVVTIANMTVSDEAVKEKLRNFAYRIQSLKNLPKKTSSFDVLKMFGIEKAEASTYGNTNVYGTNGTTNTSWGSISGVSVGSTFGGGTVTETGTGYVNVTYSNGTSVTYTASGSGSGSGSGTVVVSTRPINGVCSATHYGCAAGLLGATAEYASQWQWWCNGVNRGANTLCSQMRPPAVSLTINGSHGPLSLLKESARNFAWTTTNATSCSAASNDAWSGGKAISGSESLPANVTSNHTLTCSGPGGTASDSIQVNVYCIPETGAYAACNCATEKKTRSDLLASCLYMSVTVDCDASEKNACRDFNWKEVAP